MVRVEIKLVNYNHGTVSEISNFKWALLLDGWITMRVYDKYRRTVSVLI